MDPHLVGTVLHAGLELVLGVSIKLLCDNGRIHWRDLVNDLFFWVPGAQALACDGLGREVAALALPSPADHHDIDLPLAAK